MRTDRSAYWREFRVHARPLAAATIGLGAGMSLNAYVTSVFGPYLLSEFGWSKAQFALLGTFSLLTIVWIPFVGRATDLFGVRRVASVGMVAFPVTCLLTSMLQGDIRAFFGIVLLQNLLCLTTTTGVYLRVVATRFVAGRGFALAISASGPAVVGALGSPLMTQYIESAGWRAGYAALALFTAALNAVTFVLLPKREPRTADAPKRTAKADYGVIFRTPAFWIVLCSALLCSLPHILATSQIKVMLLEHEVSATAAGFMVSIFAGGVLAGRFVAGLALDRFPSYLVAAIGMGLPCIGLFILATDVRALLPIGIAVAFVGLSFGAEADILGYIAARYFSLEVYSSVFSLWLSAVGGALVLGSALLSYTLWKTDDFSLFMIIVGVAVLIGAANFFRLKRLETRPAVVREVMSDAQAS